MLGNRGADKTVLAAVKKHRRRLQNRRSVAEFRKKHNGNKATPAVGESRLTVVETELDRVAAEVKRIAKLTPAEAHAAILALSTTLPRDRGRPRTGARGSTLEAGAAREGPRAEPGM